MDQSAIIKLMDLLYKKYLIPMILFDSSNNPCHPKITWDTQPALTKFIVPAADRPVLLFNDFPFMYAVLNIHTGSQSFSLLVGPCGLIGQAPDRFVFHSHAYHYGIHYTKETIAAFEEFVQLLHTIFTHEILQKDALHWIYQKETHQHKTTDHRIEESLYDRRMQEATFDSYQFELRYTEYIKRNQPEKIDWLFKKMQETYQVELAGNELEGLKLKFSAFVAILTRISIDEGVPINQAFSLSDALIQGLFRIHSADEWHTYMKEATYRFMKLIHQQPLAGKSMLVKQLINYIDSHVYERVTVEELAGYCDKHKTHLSALFKKEMGQTIHSYIQERKINESKHLLLFTDKSYKEISMLLSFASQSHFIQVFKKTAGVTPREYRSQHYAHSIH
ncbi:MULTISPECIES: helix-turn-helix domain-containing protein [unclassified Enterococcus]|uniref:helix-turn-helix transcriptional regulator n=1 Tax=unclassified Enterococcus TaxID=2608891 RepID=UPI0013EC2463|nr:MULTISPECIES: helix-turn-helix domain-containing protein [unclassified Enterococcus]